MDRMILSESVSYKLDSGGPTSVLKKGTIVYVERDVRLFESDIQLILKEAEKERDTLWMARNNLQVANEQLRCCANCGTYKKGSCVLDPEEPKKKAYNNAACEDWSVGKLKRKSNG